MKAVLITLTIILISIIAYTFLPRYRSAFEADQACHFLISAYQNEENKLIGCDHDLETRQWILYQSNSSETPAKVIRRFSY